ncbi:MAG: restriction endonuclease subunit S [Bacteroidaceae bacterium]|nr:restriction endonuclease subunit S [Bacteroidaceae bacterium]
MKEGWKMVKLKNICDKASSNVAQKDLDNNNGEYPIYGASGFIKKVDFFHYDKPYIGIVKDGSGVGRVNIYPANSSLLGTLQYILPKTGYELGFVYYALQSLNLSKYKVGAAIPHIYFRDYGEKELSVPPLEEQHRIVSILDASFEKIDALKKNAEENLKNAKALFQQVLAQELKPKEGWVEKKLQDVCEIINGYAFPSSAFKKNNEVKVIKITNVGVGKFIKDDENKLPQHYLTDVENVIINELDIVVALTRTIIAEGLKVAIVPKEYDGALLNQRVAALRMYPKVLLREYLYYYFQTKYAKEYVLSRVNTLMQPNLSIKDLRDMPIPYLPFETQQHIVRILDTLSEKCRRLEEVAQQTIRECDALKQSILRQAFSGEL